MSDVDILIEGSLHIPMPPVKPPRGSSTCSDCGSDLIWEDCHYYCPICRGLKRLWDSGNPNLQSGSIFPHFDVDTPVPVMPTGEDPVSSQRAIEMDDLSRLTIDSDDNLCWDGVPVLLDLDLDDCAEADPPTVTTKAPDMAESGLWFVVAQSALLGFIAGYCVAFFLHH